MERVKEFVTNKGSVTLQLTTLFAICVNIGLMTSWKKDVEHNIEANSKFRWTSIHQIICEQEFNSENRDKGITFPSTKKILSEVDWEKGGLK